MLKLDIKPLHLFGATCYEDSIITVSNWWNREYIYGFAESWRFEYRMLDHDPDELLGNKIRYSRRVEMSNFNLYTGIEVKTHLIQDFDEALARIKSEIYAEKPVVIYIDGFWAPWDHIYQKEHFLYHACIAVGIDEENDKLICIDPFHGIEGDVDLPLDFYRNGFGPNLLTFQEMENKEALQEDWRGLIQKTISNLYGRHGMGINTFAAIEYLADELENGVDLSKEFGNVNDIWRSPLFISIETAIMGRVKFLNLISHLATKFKVNELLAFHDRFEVCINKWQVFKNKLLKLYMIDPNDTPSRLAKLLREQAKLEEALASELMQIAKQTSDSGITAPASNMDLALLATATASSHEQRYPVSNINDGLFYTEWRANNETDSAWIKLSWESPQWMTTFIIRDSTYQFININSGILSLSNGFVMEVLDIPKDGTPKELTFPEQEITWLKFQTTGSSGDSEKGEGLNGIGNSVSISQIKVY
ncbi:BtrH N-terminal domain-containing protein [Paenibacillus sp. SI8]|uniref:DUF7402 domain-containing protein n=1 Tax=unclassified Paenibacillus TaxID=185978 RepID=UPI003467B67E